jgi:hypothetical protein
LLDDSCLIAWLKELDGFQTKIFKKNVEKMKTLGGPANWPEPGTRQFFLILLV